MANKIIVVGSSNTDMIIQLNRLPVPGETIIGGKFSTAAGGKGANQAVAAARAGGKVTFISRVGADVFGDAAINGFVKDGIDVTYINKDVSEPSGVALIFIGENGENSIGVASGANARLLPDSLSSLAGLISGRDIVLLQLEIPLETVDYVTKIVQEQKAKIILNPAPAQLLNDSLLKRISVITPNETEAEFLTGLPVKNETDAEKAAKALRVKGVEAVIITLGSKGAYLSCCEYEGVIPSYKVKAVDTTAAGDVFNGAFTVALSEGKRIKDAVMFGNAAAALSVTRLGAQPSAPFRNEIDDMLS
jgi:ribokinase